MGRRQNREKCRLMRPHHIGSRKRRRISGPAAREANRRTAEESSLYRAGAG